jgi:hypothetical protein
MTPAQVEAALRKRLDAVRRAAEAALYQAGSIIMTEAKQRAPVDVGTLRNSGYVTLPRRQGGDTFVEAGFGGAAKAYAVRQHEELAYRHEVGEAKYLENAINAKEQQVREHVKRIAGQALASGAKTALGPKIHTEVPQ